MEDKGAIPLKGADPAKGSDPNDFKRNSNQRQEGTVVPYIDPTDGPEVWVDRYGDYLYRFAYVRLGNREVAEDVVQETLMAAIQSWRNFEGRSTVRTWLVSILKRKIIDNIRKVSSRRLASVTAEEALEGFNGLGLWNVILKDWARKPDELLEQQRFMDALRECVAGLPERSRSVLTMATVDGMEGSEICEIMKISKENLWVLIHRARMALRKCVEGQVGKYTPVG